MSARIIGSCIVIALCFLRSAAAQEDADLDALQLANQIPSNTTTIVPGNWRLFSEASLGGSLLRDIRHFQPNQRASFDLQYDDSFAPNWHAFFSDRLDIQWPAVAPASNATNTIKETYLSWQAQTNLLLDLGRINERNGVAFSYNPTDYFKTDALRSIVSIDPKSLKENRQGSIMLRAQKLSDDGSLSVLYSPKLHDRLNHSLLNPETSSAFNPNIAATNHENRWLIRYSKKITEEFSPQFLLFKSEQTPIQFGLNLTSLVNDATVLFLEWSGGRSASLLTQALQQQGMNPADDSTFRNRFSSGLTYTTRNKISLTAEFEYNGAGQNKNSWNALQNPTSTNYLIYRNFLLATQESPTRQNAFFYATWQDAGINHLDLNAMQRINLSDSSRLSWLELRYHLSQSEYAFQWQRFSGNPLSEFGAAPQIQSWAIIGRYYF